MTHWQNGKRPGVTGQHHHKAKLTSADVATIRTLHHFGLSIKSIAEKYETAYSTIYDITHYKTRSNG